MADSIITLNDQVVATGWLAAAVFFGFMFCVFFLGLIIGLIR